VGSSHPFRHQNKPRNKRRRTDTKSRDLALVAVYASLYAVLVYAFSPVSFYALQFRVAGILRPAIAKKWILALGYAIGVIVGNILSPFAGIFELVFMPTMSFLAGAVGYLVAKPLRGNYFVAGTVIATMISVSVSWMLNQLFNLPIFATLPYLFLSEQAICIIGALVLRLIDTRFRWW
jgi:uncharacterized membrane protein